MRIEALFWPLIIGAGVIWAVVMALAVIAYRTGESVGTERQVRAYVVWGGVVFPAVVLTGLLTTGLLTLRGIAAQPAQHAVAVDGEQWWWRVRYDGPGGPVVSANELRLPRGQTVRLELTSDDVIHSFWAPALGGKMDMIPGRTTHLTLTPEKTGSWGGLCAEFCGSAHAQMLFRLVVMEPGDYARWLADEARPAQAGGPGLEVFLEEGCGACHTIRGTDAQGPVGPDLTHFAGRETLGAGIRPLTRTALRNWIRYPGAIKPGVRMPGYPEMPEARLDRLVDFLLALK